MSEDMDVNAGSIIEGKTTINEVGQTIFDCVIDVASGGMTVSEPLGHKEFILTYKKFDATGSSNMAEAMGPSCLR